MRAIKVPVWALLLSIPMAFLTMNCGPATNTNDDQNNAALTAPSADAVNADEVVLEDDELDNGANKDLNLTDGQSNDWRWGRRWGGWGGYGYGYGGWGSWGWPYYSSWYYPYYLYF